MNNTLASLNVRKTNKAKHKKTRSTILAAAVSLSLLFVNASFATSESPEDIQPLIKISKKMGFDDIQLVDDIDYKKYTKVFLREPTVTFHKSWERDHRTDVSSRYKEMIIEDYSKLLTEELTKALTANDKIEIVDKKAANHDETLSITPRIMNLYINAPETITASTGYVHEAGRATLQLQLMNAKKKIIGIIEDNQDTTDRGFLDKPQKASRVSNYYDFRLLMRSWANNFAELLQKTPIKDNINKI